MNKVLLTALCICLTVPVVHADGLFGKRYHRKMASAKSNAVRPVKTSAPTPAPAAPETEDPFAQTEDVEAPVAEETPVSLPAVAEENCPEAISTPEKATETPARSARTSQTITTGTPDKAGIAEVRKVNLKELRASIKSIRQEVKKAKKSNGSRISDTQILHVILAILLPPLAVFLHEGGINNTFWLNVILTLLFYVPGQIHALLVVFDVV